jgi:hypothetical protein
MSPCAPSDETQGYAFAGIRRLGRLAKGSGLALIVEEFIAMSNEIAARRDRSWATFIWVIEQTNGLPEM